MRQDVQTVNGATVSFTLIPKAHPTKSYIISQAFTADQLSLSEHSHPVKSLQRRYPHLRQLPLIQLNKVKPLLFLGADQTHLITPKQPVKLGPPGAPVEIKTRLGWTLQGPARDLTNSSSTHFHHISFKCPTDDIYHNVQKLWQLDALPQRNMKAVVRSKRDQEAMHQLETPNHQNTCWWHPTICRTSPSCRTLAPSEGCQGGSYVPSSQLWKATPSKSTTSGDL